MSDVRGNLIDAEKLTLIMREEVERELWHAALEIEEHIRRSLRDNDHIFTGLLANSMTSAVNSTGTEIAVQVGTPVEYGRYVEFGTAPHFPPIEPIKRWVEQKIQPHVTAVGVSFDSGRATPTGRGTRRLRGNARERAISSLAWAIAISMSRKGTKGKFFMRDALDAIGAQYLVVDGEYRVDVAALLTTRAPGLWSRINARHRS